MSLVITNSPDIGLLRVAVTFDLTQNVDSNGNVQPTPKVKLQNLSTGTNLQNVSYAFLVISPSQTIIHNGDISNPDIVGVWYNTVLDDRFPMPAGNIEFSPVPFTFQVTCQDSVGNIYTAPVQNATIIRPNGNTTASQDMTGLASTIATVQCSQQSVLFQDQTNYGYNGLIGTQISSTLSLKYPLDGTGTSPIPFVANNYAVCSAPLTVSSDAYEFVQNSIYNYAYGNDTYVTILYFQRKTFAALCNIDLSPLVCEITKLEDTIRYGTCVDISAARDQLMQINSLFIQVVIGLWQPLTGVDVPATIEKIKRIGKFSCNCYGIGSGIVTGKNAISNGINYILNPSGDITGSYSATGNNVTLTIGDITYLVAVDPSNEDAYSWSTSVSGDQKTYTLKVNEAVLAQDLVNAILANPNLINQLNQSSNFDIIVDGKCVFNSSVANNYTFTLSNIPTGVGVYAILTSFQLQSESILTNFTFNTNNLPALQTYLNTLGIGTFSVSGDSPADGTIHIVSNTNPNVIIGLNYSVASSNYAATFTKTSGGYVPIPAQTVIQNIINKICTLDTSEVFTSQSYTVPALNNSTGLEQDIVVAQGGELDIYIQAVNTALGSLVSYSLGNKGTNCNVVKGVFGTPASSVLSTDILLGVFANACGFATPLQLARAIMAIGITDTQFLNNFCIASTICANTTSCPLILSFLYNISGTHLNITKLAFDTIPTSAQTVTVLYRVSGHSPAYPYTTYSTAITVGSNGYLVTPVSIPVTVGVTYDIQVLQNCSSPASGVEQTILVTPPSIATVVQLGTVLTTAVCSQPYTTIYTTSSFASGVTLYTDSGTSIPISNTITAVALGDGTIWAVTNAVVGALQSINCP